jgi:transposase
MAIVMGLDQHRAQITAEWIDTDSGELGRGRISPALRGDVRRFFQRFAGQRLEVALEATMGWRFVVEELRAIGAEVHDLPLTPEGILVAIDAAGARTLNG